MQTHFSLAALADPDMARSEKILRACVHCGFCTATCPTFLLTGDELDSPRGRIYLIKEMLENERPADARTTRHIDRCLSCLSCMTTCPSSVHYMHLVDHARAHIEQTFSRPLSERFLRGALAFVLARPRLFRLAQRRLSPRRCRDGCPASSRWPRSACRRPRRWIVLRFFHRGENARCASPCLTAAPKPCSTRASTRLRYGS